MKFNQPILLRELAELTACEFRGEGSQSVLGINEIHRVSPGDIVFVDHPKYYNKALQSKATVVIIDKDVPCPSGKGLILSENPFRVFNEIAAYYYARRVTFPTDIGLQTKYPGVFFGNNVRVGERVRINPGVCLMDDTIVGNDVIIGSNSVIGHHAFYYKKTAGKYQPMFNCGNVEIADGVEIGANCTIDRGVTDTTFIGRGTKIDNLVQIGHDTRIGEHCLFASQVGIAGCVDIGDGVTFWGQVGCASGVSIGSGATVLAQSGISKDLDGNATYFGSPCGEFREKFKELAAIKQLPSMIHSAK
ncbi:MAG: LpxD N-terminal domain-containing protein [Bacteroidota bacterium]